MDLVFDSLVFDSLVSDSLVSDSLVSDSLVSDSLVSDTSVYGRVDNIDNAGLDRACRARNTFVASIFESSVHSCVFIIDPPGWLKLDRSYNLL